MGLEPESAADIADTGWEQWKWMRNYRVWEANRKVFLYPENWIEPELLDDKSALFQALEERAAAERGKPSPPRTPSSRYLEGLDGISFLEVVAVYYQTEHQDDARLRAHKGRRSGAILLPQVRAGALLDALGKGRPRYH